MKFQQSALVLAGIMSLATVFAADKAIDTNKAAKNNYHQQKVIYHISDIQNAKAALRNAKNHLNAVGDENIDLVIITHSSGAYALVDGAMGEKDAEGKAIDVRDDIASLANRGVKFQICANTIKGKKIPKEKVSELAEIIPSGVAHLAHMQHKGYVYVKP